MAKAVNMVNVNEHMMCIFGRLSVVKQLEKEQNDEGDGASTGVREGEHCDGDGDGTVVHRLRWLTLALRQGCDCRTTFFLGIDS
jgi:hypothetical protein